MAATMAVIKTLLAPAVVSLILYIFASLVVKPLWSRYRNRYTHYLPLNGLTDQTSSLRQRIQAHIGWLLRVPVWPTVDGLTLRGGVSDEDDDDDDDTASALEIFGLAHAEELGDLDSNNATETRRHLDRNALRGGHEPVERLSRDLEEVFKDDSDEEEMPGARRS